MFHQLVRIHRGKETVMMVDELSKVQDRLKVLKNSQRGMPYRYEIREAVGRVKKYKKKHKFRSH